jgi:hypothetical protein
VRRLAKASSAGSSPIGGQFRLLIGIAVSAAFFLVPASEALAEFKVEFAGAGTGTVISTPAGVECSNTPGNEKESAADCADQFPFGFENVQLTAVPDPGSAFGGWATVNTLDGDCIGTTNPCKFTDGGEFGFPPVTVTATFEPPPPPPVATTGGVSEVKPLSAKLEGEVNPEGHGVGSCRFEYGTTTAYGLTSLCKPPSLGAGTSPVAVSATTSLIDPGTTYHYRLVASNSGGASEGEDKTFTTSAAAPDECSNAARRSEQGSRALSLPECMAFEQVSPPKKFNQYARQAVPSADGDRVYFQSVSALAETPREGSIFEPYVATRTENGWLTSPTAPPAKYTTGPGTTAVPCAFNQDLTHWNMLAATGAEGKEGIATAFQGSLGGSLVPISPRLVPIPGSNFSGQTIFETECEGSSADASHEFVLPFNSGLAWLPGDPVGGINRNLYEFHIDESGAPTVELVARDKNGVVVGGGCTAAIGTGGNLRSRKGAISADASIVYFTTRPGQASISTCESGGKPIRIMKRTMTSDGPVISEVGTSECTRVAPACGTSNLDDTFMGASQESDRVLILTSRQMTNSDLDATADLYLYEGSQPSGQRLTQVSAGDVTDPTPGSGAQVIGVSEFSGDGSRIYFVANGRLTLSPNRLGQSAVANEPNLYMYQRGADDPAGRTVFIGTLASEDKLTGFAPGNNQEAQAVPQLGQSGEPDTGGDGHILAFVSRASLTPDDTDGEIADVYRYDSETGALKRISKAAPGGSDGGSGATEVAANYSEFNISSLGSLRHWISEDGSSIVFSTTEGLTPTDVDGRLTAYRWRDGELTAVAPEAFNMPPTISLDGSLVSFTSEDRLVRQDRDLAPDVYVARPGGGFPFTEPPPPCSGEACQGSPEAPPASQGSKSSSFVGPGNQAPKKKGHKKKHRTKKHHKKTRHGQGGHK